MSARSDVAALLTRALTALSLVPPPPGYEWDLRLVKSPLEAEAPKTLRETLAMPPRAR